MVLNPEEVISLKMKGKRYVVGERRISDLFVGEVRRIRNVSDKVMKLDHFIKGLEDEMRKIDAFKRELPYTIHLITDGFFSFSTIIFFYYYYYFFCWRVIWLVGFGF